MLTVVFISEFSYNKTMYRGFFLVVYYKNMGATIYVEGKLRTRKWQDKQGRERYTTEIVAEGMQLLGSRAVGPAAKPAEQDPWEAEVSEAPDALGLIGSRDDDYPF